MCLKRAVAQEMEGASTLSNRRNGVQSIFLQEPLQYLNVMPLWPLSMHLLGCKGTSQEMQQGRRPLYVNSPPHSVSIRQSTITEAPAQSFPLVPLSMAKTRKVKD